MKLSGARILYVTADPEPVRRQLAGASLLRGFAEPLADAVSTDEMTPAWACYYYDEQLGRFCLVGLRGGVVTPGAVQAGGFSVLVGGENFGCGSSRETAPYAQRACGIRLVVARSFARIYRNNCHNLGVFTSTDLSLAERLEAGDDVTLDALLEELDPLSRAIVSAGGLAHYRAAELTPRTRTAAPRPRTLAEKLLLSHCDREAGDLVPGDALFVRADIRFSHDYTTAMVDAQFRAAFGESARVTHPESVFLFRDHLALLDRVMPSAHRRLGLLSQAEELASVQRAFAERQQIRLYDELPGGGSVGICHNVVIEQLALPGDVVVGTDSHTCMAGVLGCLAFGVGSTDMAAGLVTREFRVTVPETVRVDFTGALPPGTCAKDVWLSLFAREDVRAGLFRGRVIEFGGPGYYALPLDERATLTNMAAEGGAFTALSAPDAVVFEYIARERGLDLETIQARAVHPDAEAAYAARLSVELGAIEPMLALPGDPYRTMPLRELGARCAAPVRVDIAYGGSCTGGKRLDMDLYARVLAAALSRSEKVAPGVSLFIQFGSEAIRRYAIERGYVEVFRAAGATLLEPACGACIRSGPGTSEREDQVTVSAINRNFPGRSGPGQVYLASPLVVAASAIRGEIALPEWAR